MTKQVLDVQQMQHLQELGLDTSNASLCYYKQEGWEANYFIALACDVKEKVGLSYYYDSFGNKEYILNEVIPAYSLQDVLDALPASIKHKDFRYYLVYNKSEGFIGYYRVDFDGNNRYARYEEFYNGIDGLSVIDAAYSMLCWTIEQGYVETNKNE